MGWRPEPESNRRARICSPLRNHSAIGPEATPFPGFSKMVKPAEPVARPIHQFALRFDQRPFAPLALRPWADNTALHPRCIRLI